MPRASSRSSCERLGQLGARAPRQLLGRRRVVADAAGRNRSWIATRDEPLLRAVVEVALEPPALGVAGRDDALARGLQLVEPGVGLGCSCSFSSAIAAAAETASTSSRVVVERGVVRQRGDGLAVALDGDDPPLARLRRQRDGVAPRVDVPAARRDAGDDEPGIAERARERRLEVGAAHPAQAAHEIGEPRPGEPRAQQAGQEQRGDEAERGDREPQMQLRALARADEVVDEQRREQRAGATAPPTLGSSARRRGGDATRQRAAITSTVATQPPSVRTRWVRSSACAIPSSGITPRRLPSWSRNTIQNELQDDQREDEHADEQCGRSSSGPGRPSGTSAAAR